MATTTISTIIKGELKAAGYDSERLTAHSLRHTAGTTVQQITKNLHETQRYMRHASPVTTEIYIHDIQTDEEADTAQRLYNAYHGQQTEGDSLQDIMARMTPEQLNQLTRLAAAMA